MDPVRRQLKLLDTQLVGRARPVSYILTTAPLLPLTISMIAGIVVQQYLDVHIGFSIAVLAIALAAAVVSGFGSDRHRRLLLLSLAAFPAFLSLGAMRLNVFYTPANNDLGNFVDSTRVLATIRGVVRNTPFIEDKDSWAFGSFLWGKPATSFYMTVDQVETPTGFKQTSGTVRVQVSDTVKDVGPGDRIEIHCWLSRFQPPANPGQFDLAESLKRRNIHLAASVSNANGVKVLQKNPPGSLFYTFRGKLKKLAAEALLNEHDYSSESNAMLAALILGQRSSISPATNEAFRKTGLAHFISLSGMHIGILAGTLWMLCKHIGLTRHWR
ncbi:MAG: ComEC/Rec2 family competence protein, partial [Anaerohalosphaera sp.]|nr:ComEC/Rec2 family competence protein [Anaerohalosphaera sp.]